MTVQPWCFGRFRLDPETACLWLDQQLVPLPPKPFAVLAHLVTHAGDVVTSTVKDLVAGARLHFDDGGSHAFSQIAASWSIYAVRHEILTLG